MLHILCICPYSSSAIGFGRKKIIYIHHLFTCVGVLLSLVLFSSRGARLISLHLNDEVVLVMSERVSLNFVCVDVGRHRDGQPRGLLSFPAPKEGSEEDDGGGADGRLGLQTVGS